MPIYEYLCDDCGRALQRHELFFKLIRLIRRLRLHASHLRLPLSLHAKLAGPKF